MDFRLDDEQLALRDAVSALCRQHFPLDDIAGRDDTGAWRALSEMGVFDLLAPDQPGGAVEAAIVNEQFGAHLGTGPLLWTMIARPLVPDAERITGTDRESLVIEHADSDVVLALSTSGVLRCVLREPLAGEPFDPLTPTVAYAEVSSEMLASTETAERLRRLGTVLAAAQLVGVAQGALDVASAYALERHQFGVPIGSFQAVKHLLADMFVRVELARAATYAAAAIFDDWRAGNIDVAASTAKLLAGEAGITNGRTAVQVLGGMGFTWEMTPHYFLKRAWLLEESFGTGDAHAIVLSDAVVPAWT